MKQIILILLLAVSFGCSKQQKAPVSELAGSSVESYDVQNGQYFLYADGYHCNLKGKTVISYKDSIYFDGKKLCQTGDVCTNSKKCVDMAKLKDLHIYSDQLQVEVFGQTYLYGSDLSETNGLPDLAAERQIASVNAANPTNSPTQKLILYFMWCIAFGILFYMHAPEF